MTSGKRLYIAYGSNLNKADMKCRCPIATVVGIAELKDYELLFRNHATVEMQKGSTVPVVVWEIQPQDEKQLDFYEGFPSYYGKEEMDVKLESSSVSAMIYTMNPGYQPALPSPFYRHVIEEGYITFGFDTAVLDQAMKRTWDLMLGLEHGEPEGGAAPSMHL